MYKNVQKAWLVLTIGLIITLLSLIITPPTNAAGFANYPTGYPDYYNFVKNKLFDGQEAFTTSSPTSNATGSNIWFLPSLSAEQFNNGFWQSGWPAQCSQASMAEIFNAYKKPDDNQLTIGDVEKVGQSLGSWDTINGFHFGTPGPGQQNALEKEANNFNFTIKTYINVTGVISYVDVGNIIKIAQSGNPVMISAPGHWLVLWGADANWQSDPNGKHIWLLDSSGRQYTWADPNTQQIGKLPDPAAKNDPKAYPGYIMNYKMSLTDFLYGTPVVQPRYWTGIGVVFVPQGSSTAGGGNPPPNSNTCNGTYNLHPNIPPQYTLAHQNFGDPTCNYTKNALFNQLNQVDPVNAAFWYLTVVPCESGYSPNAVQYPDPYDPGLAWGLFQMGRGKNGQYDHGDVYWQTQTTNAVTYNNGLIGARHWTYWACARSRWGQ